MRQQGPLESLHRIVLLVRLQGPRSGETGNLEVTDVETKHRLEIGDMALVLTLETEPEATVSRGHLRSLQDEAIYPIQTNRALFNALAAYVEEGETQL